MEELPPADVLLAQYEAHFRAHGRTPQGVNWPNAKDLVRRFDVMLGLLRPGPGRPSLLDLGCGPGLLLDHLETIGRRGAIDYSGIDLSEPMLDAARRHWPGYDFSRRDIVGDPLPARAFDYVILNGVLTWRPSVPRPAMVDYALELLTAAFAAARVGVAFNVMSKHVDWERDDLFHWGFDEMAAAVGARLSRHLAIRADYGLYEYTVYVYREPSA
ncbi:MAG: class I SAM-dependent methyltransferase [Proteobacteria bacterium]|nr:class I SAM-dependent methyltransferase [Pseudomonadota bacterium]